MKYHREDDKRTVTTITGVMSVLQRMPKKGQKIIYTGWVDIGIQYVHDHHGYAIIHTAKKLQVWKDAEYVVKDFNIDKCYNGLNQITIEAYSTKTTIE